LRRRDAVGEEPDYRFTLANERTFLAYVRTSLGLDAAGLAAVQFLTSSADPLRLTVGIALIGLGGLVAVLGYIRWDSAEQAIRGGAPLPAIRLPLVLSVGMLAVSAVALALVLSNR
jgi:putative membrane protein